MLHGESIGRWRQAPFVVRVALGERSLQLKHPDGDAGMESTRSDF